MKVVFLSSKNWGTDSTNGAFEVWEKLYRKHNRSPPYMIYLRA